MFHPLPSRPVPKDDARQPCLLTGARKFIFVERSVLFERATPVSRFGSCWPKMQNHCDAHGVFISQYRTAHSTRAIALLVARAMRFLLQTTNNPRARAKNAATVSQNVQMYSSAHDFTQTHKKGVRKSSIPVSRLLFFCLQRRNDQRRYNIVAPGVKLPASRGTRASASASLLLISMPARMPPSLEVTSSPPDLVFVPDTA